MITHSELKNLRGIKMPRHKQVYEGNVRIATVQCNLCGIDIYQFRQIGANPIYGVITLTEYGIVGIKEAENERDNSYLNSYGVRLCKECLNGHTWTKLGSLPEGTRVMSSCGCKYQVRSGYYGLNHVALMKPSVLCAESPRKSHGRPVGYVGWSFDNDFTVYK